VKKAADLAKAKGAKRAVLLPVSAPFHSALLKPAAERLAGVLRGIRFRDLAVPLVTNVDADLLTEGAGWRIRWSDSDGPVRWEDVVLRLAKEGVTVCVEVGPGKVLSGLIRRIAPEMQVLNVEDRASLQSTLEPCGEPAGSGCLGDRRVARDRRAVAQALASAGAALAVCARNGEAAAATAAAIAGEGGQAFGVARM